MCGCFGEGKVYHCGILIIFKGNLKAQMVCRKVGYLFETLKDVFAPRIGSEQLLILHTQRTTLPLLVSFNYKTHAMIYRPRMFLFGRVVLVPTSQF